jgi:hypothetical protein
MKHVSARLHVLLARDAPTALVIRRGPSKEVATVGWNRNTDTFKVGQWLKGRIYERRCDLSPDGKYLIYFAMNGYWKTKAQGSWTAISRAPYLKALGMFPKGDCWHGGGLWTGVKRYWLNDGMGHSVLHQTSEVERDSIFQPTTNYGGECFGVYFPRLLRDGWSLIERVVVDKWKVKYIFEKVLPHGWTLRKIAHAEVGAPVGKGVYWDEHELVFKKSGETITCPSWEWADVDGKRLVWAEEGSLHSGKITRDGLANQINLFDFNQMKFAPLKAPY